jgi:hypothetical protein
MPTNSQVVDKLTRCTLVVASNLPKVLLIAALGAACEVAETELAAAAHHMLKLRTRLCERFERAASNGEVSIRVNGPCDPMCRLPNTLSIGFAGMCCSRLVSVARGGVWFGILAAAVLAVRLQLLTITLTDLQSLLWAMWSVSVSGGVWHHPRRCALGDLACSDQR